MREAEDGWGERGSRANHARDSKLNLKLQCDEMRSSHSCWSGPACFPEVEMAHGRIVGWQQVAIARRQPPRFAPPMPDPLRVQSGIDLLVRNLLLKPPPPPPASSSIHHATMWMTPGGNILALWDAQGSTHAQLPHHHLLNFN